MKASDFWSGVQRPKELSKEDPSANYFSFDSIDESYNESYTSLSMETVTMDLCNVSWSHQQGRSFPLNSLFMHRWQTQIRRRYTITPLAVRVPQFFFLIWLLWSKHFQWKKNWSAVKAKSQIESPSNYIEFWLWKTSFRMLRSKFIELLLYPRRDRNILVVLQHQFYNGRK